MQQKTALEAGKMEDGDGVFSLGRFWWLMMMVMVTVMHANDAQANSEAT